MLYLSGIIIALFLASVLISKRKKTGADIILTAWLFVIGFHLITYYLMFSKKYDEYPALIALGFPLPLAHGPFLYLYTRLQTTPTPVKKGDLFHFVPVLLSYLLFGSFFFMNTSQQAEIFRWEGRGFEMQMMINRLAIFISGIVYVTLALRQLINYRRRLPDRFSNTERINFNWLLYLIIWMIIIWILVIFTHKDWLIFGTVAIFVVWLGYFSIRQVQVFQSGTVPISMGEATPFENDTQYQVGDTFETSFKTSSAKYRNSGLSRQDADVVHQRLRQVMAAQKPYTDPELTLVQLASLLEVHPNILSQVINSLENKSFYDLINAMRVEEFMQRISLPGNQQFTLMSIAYDCGFNSKASFNRNFKKYTGCTPSDYVKELQKAEV